MESNGSSLVTLLHTDRNVNLKSINDQFKTYTASRIQIFKNQDHFTNQSELKSFIEECKTTFNVTPDPTNNITNIKGKDFGQLFVKISMVNGKMIANCSTTKP